MKTKFGIALWIVAGVLGEIYAIILLTYYLGLIGAILAIMFAPFAIIAAPIYAALAQGAWLPLVIVYGLAGMGWLFVERKQL